MSNQDAILRSIATRRGRISAPEAAADTGLGLRACTRRLNTIAELCGAKLEPVAGTAVYVFPDNIQGAIAARKVKEQSAAITKLGFETAHWLLRVSFGLLLLASFLIVIAVCVVTFGILALIAILTHLHFHGHMFLHFLEMFDLQNLYYFFCWRQRDDKENTYTYLGRTLDFRGDGLYYNCYTFLFGDTDPNRGIREESMQHIKSLIQNNNGAISWAQVVPLLATPSPREADGMLPILTSFDGLPQVNASGKLFYVFPELQSDADVATRVMPPSSLRELSWQFTREPMKKIGIALGFGCINLWAWYSISNNAGLIELFHPYEWVVSMIVDYAGFFLAFPMIREFANATRNGAIEYRNSVRLQAAEALAPHTVPPQAPMSVAMANHIT